MSNFGISFARGRGPGRTVDVAVTSGPFTVAAGSAYAMCLGRELYPVSSLRAHVHVHGVAAAGAGWAEIAVATGVFVPNSNSQTLTVRAWASIDAEVKAGASVLYNKLLTPSTPITSDEDIWILVASSHAVTQSSFRILTDAEQSGLPCTRVDATGATTRPSLNVGVARVFTGTVGLGLNVPQMKYQVVS